TLIPAGLLLSTLHTSRAWASECQNAFAQWAQQSEELVQRTQGASGRGGCIASESARRDLLDALARTRRLCGDSGDPSEEQTRTMLYINQSFISSLSVCRSQTEEAGNGWAPKAAPTPERPKTATPLPVAPPPAPPPAPITGGPRPSVITP